MMMIMMRKAICTNTLNELGRTRQWWKVTNIFEDMQLCGIDANVYHYNKAIHIFAQKGDVKRAEQWS